MRTKNGEETTKDLLELGLTNANPMFINDNVLRVLEKGTQGYVLYVLEDTVLAGSSVIKLHPDSNSLVGVTLEKGYYHIVATEIALTSGSALLYTRVN